jgi:hypothetical protein
MSSQDTEPLVYVEWVDSSGHDGWAPRNDLADHARPSTCRTVGLVVLENDQALTIAQTLDDTHGNFNAAMTIPKFAIITREALKPDRRARGARRWLSRS